MQQHNNVSRQWSLDAWSQLKRLLPRRRLPSLATILLVLATLACGFIETSSRSTTGDIILTRLPTLTRTPLPTLTPTSSSKSVAVVLAAESFESAPTLASQPENAPTASNVSATSSASLLADTSTAPDKAVGNYDTGIANEIDSSTLLDTPTTVPTDTPTSTPTVTPTETPVPSSTSTEPPLPTSTPTPTATPTPLPKDWLFNGVHIYPDPNKGRLLLYGNLVNNTELPQELISIVGTFLDEQDQVIATTSLADAYWPGFVVSPGGSMPFEVTVKGIESAANYTLSVEAQPSGDVPREDFEFSNLKQAQDGDDYCVEGEFKNSGDGLRDYLVLTAVLFNGQDNVVNFGHYSVYYPEGVEADPDFEFDLCADSLDQQVTRFELLAWGL